MCLLSTTVGHVYEGQFPVWNGTAFEVEDAIGQVTVCWDFYITNGTAVWENVDAFSNSIKEALDLQHWE